MRMSERLACCILCVCVVALARTSVNAGQLPLDPAKSAELREQMFKQRGNDELQSIVQPFKVFDNVYYVGDGGVSSWLVVTKDGLVLIDANREPIVEHVVARIRKLGFEPKNIKYMLVSEGHQDHSGGAAYIQEHFGARVVMLREDWDLAVDPKAVPASARVPKRDIVAKDGQTITVGDAAFRIHQLPGHTNGGMSMEFTVYDGGKPHKAFLFAGSANRPGMPLDMTEKLVASTRKVEQMTGIEVNIQNHPWLMGNVLEKAERLARRRPGEPHPFVEPEAFRAWATQNRIGAEKQLEAARRSASGDTQ